MAQGPTCPPTAAAARPLARTSRCAGVQASRRSFGISLGLALVSLDAPGHAAPAPIAPLSVYLDSIRTAQEELRALQSKISLAGSANTQLPFSDLQKMLQSGELGRIREASVGADEYLGEDNLEAWEEAAWEAMPQAEDKWRDGMRSIEENESSAGRGITKLRLPALDRTNELACLIFSCFNDPRQPPSTNHLLTFKMLQDGVSMGARGDKRITSDGLSLIIDDLQGNFENFVDTTSVMEVDEPVREGAVWSGWQAPTAELSEALLARLLAQPDVEGAVSLAVTSRHWADTVADAEPCWSEAVRQRWSVWGEACDAMEPQAVKAWLTDRSHESNEDGEMQDTSPDDEDRGDCTWRNVYLLWNQSVQRAVRSALYATDLQAAPCNRQGSSVMYKLWAWPPTQDIEFSSWQKALEVMSHAKLSPLDVAHHFLTSDDALINFLGVHYLMMEPWASNKNVDLPPTKARYPAEWVPSVHRLLAQHGCADKRIVVRWWELGMLVMGAGWRTMDQMHTVDASMGNLLSNASFWRMLLRGVQLEVRRIVVSEE
eukprot:jgi/Tetstr1/449183/TSEL_036390.t2